jgi:hypothetical protein
MPQCDINAPITCGEYRVMDGELEPILSRKNIILFEDLCVSLRKALYYHRVVRGVEKFDLSIQSEFGLNFSLI